MADESRPPSVAEQVRSTLKGLEAQARQRAADEAGRAALEAAVAGVGRAATGLLDAVESALFGKVGGAEEALRQEEGADPLERARARYGGQAAGPGKTAAAPPTPAAPAESAEARARRQLEEMKAARKATAAPSEADPPIRKSL